MILCDNLVFELQAVGGVSKVWAKNIERLDRTTLNLSFLEGPGAAENNFRSDLTLTHPIIHEKGSVTLRRFRGPLVTSNVFHSSYYRVSRNARFNIVTIHDFMNEMYPSSFRDPILAHIKRRACRHANRIVVVSERTRRDLLRHYPDIDPGIVEVIYNGVDEEFYPEPLNDSIQANGELIEPGSYFLYVGTRGYCKNFPYVMTFMREAWAQGLKHRLVIIGGGLFSEKERARFSVLNLPNDAILQLTGVDNVTLRRLYSNCVALLIPSIYEGFGLPALEAASCGSLVLASRGSALDEIVGETDYSFDLTSKGEIGRVLSIGFDNASAAIERSRLLQRTKLFSWDRSVERLAEIYDDFDHC